MSTDISTSPVAQSPSRSAAEWNDWHWQMENSLTSRIDLAEVEATYPFRVTPYYLSLADEEDLTDPILRQCMPDPAELHPQDSGREDPFDEHKHMPVPGLIHRYTDRALLVATTRCAVNCRHCTRKNTITSQGSVAGPRGEKTQQALTYIEEHREIREVIVSGGDPLLLEDAELDELLGAVQEISHVEVLRIGTRVPVVLPMRIDEKLANLLACHRPLWVNTQFNHPREITPDAMIACERLLTRGIPVSNQSVLLKGVNDSLPVMKELCNDLQRHMIKPYYVFLCDPVKGTACYATGTDQARKLADELRQELGGLAMPRFVADRPGARSKLPI